MLVIALATSQVLAKSASGRVQPAAGRPVAAGVVPVTAVPCSDGHARVLGLLLLLLPEQPAIRPAATASAATACRRPPPVPDSSPTAHTPGLPVLDRLSQPGLPHRRTPRLGHLHQVPANGTTGVCRA